LVDFFHGGLLSNIISETYGVDALVSRTARIWRERVSGKKERRGKGEKGLMITKIGGHSTHRSNVASLLGADQYHPYATQ
jgi:hypothetical protein